MIGLFLVSAVFLLTSWMFIRKIAASQLSKLEIKGSKELPPEAIGPVSRNKLGSFITRYMNDPDMEGWQFEPELDKLIANAEHPQYNRRPTKTIQPIDEPYPVEIIDYREQYNRRLQSLTLNREDERIIDIDGYKIPESRADAFRTHLEDSRQRGMSRWVGLSNGPNDPIKGLDSYGY